MYFENANLHNNPELFRNAAKNIAQISIFPPNEKNVIHTYPSITEDNRQQHPCGASSYSINFKYFVLYFFLF